jgi:hypothetical protein
MIAAVTIIALFSRYFIFTNTEKKPNDVGTVDVIYNSTPEKAANKSTGENNIKPSSTSINPATSKPTEILEPSEKIPAVNIHPTPVQSTVSASHGNTSKPKSKPKTVSNKPKKRVVEPTTAPLPTVITHINKTAPKNVSATDAPGALILTSSSAKVDVGDNIILTVRMDNGNNGTSLNLYENGSLMETYPLKDNTPDPQTKTVVVITTTKGRFTYYFKLSNEYGTSTSNSITVDVE